VDVLHIVIGQVGGQRQSMGHRRETRLKRSVRGILHGAIGVDSVDPFSTGKHDAYCS
jgi:hypothetical protein